MKELVIVGAGGFGRELLQLAKEIIRIENKWSIKGFIDDNLHALDDYACDHRIIGKISEWKPSDNEEFACAIANPQIKEIVTEKLKEKGAVFTDIIHPSAMISDFVHLGEGIVIYPHVVIGPNVKIGKFVTLLTSTGIGHDTVIDDYVTFSSFSDITGGNKVGKKVFGGSRITIIPKRKIGEGAYIGAGSVVMTNIKPQTKVMGNPAKQINF